MRHPLLVAVCLCAIPAAGPARAQLNWSLGANLGYEASRPVEPGPRHLSQVGWPNFGLRLGVAAPNSVQEFYLLTSFDYLSTPGSFLTRYVLSANVQKNLSSSGLSPYLTAGVGMRGVNSANNATTDTPPTASGGAVALTVGFGLGLRHPVASRHGVLRGEVRYDWNDDGKVDGLAVIPTANSLGVRLGFDMWMR